MDSFDYEQSIWGRGVADLSWSSPTHIRLFQALRMVRFLPASPRLLEVGCGAGQFIRALKEYIPSAQCFGCDISEHALVEARREPSNVEYLVSTPQRLPYADASMDGVYIFDVLEHVDNPEELLTEIHRVLKPQGLFYCFVPCEGDWLSMWHFLDMLHLKKGVTKQYAGHINYFSRKNLLHLVKSQGFGIKYIRYSEHVLGQLLGIVSFFMMRHWGKKTGVKQINNEDFFTQQNSAGGSRGLFHLVKKIINFSISLYAHIFSRVPSPNVHMVLKKQ